LCDASSLIHRDVYIDSNTVNINKKSSHIKLDLIQ
jgi:hypothetical protein